MVATETLELRNAKLKQESANGPIRSMGKMLLCDTSRTDTSTTGRGQM